VIQCIARGVQGLPITELELITVAFAVLNFVIYLLWWEKPLNVQRGVRVYKKRTTEEPVNDGDVEATVGFWGALGDALSHLPAAIAHGPDLVDLKYSPWPIRVLMWPLFKPFYISFPGYGGDSTIFQKRVNTFYPHERVEAGLIFCLVAFAFGGVHCI